jgi:PEP-CTERM motif
MAGNRSGSFRTFVGATALWGAANASAYADPPFGVVGGPIDLSANVSEAILPGGTIFHDSDPVFGTEPNLKQSAELLYTSPVGVNPSDHSKLSSAFASSLTESDGNGGVGASQLIFGLPNPGGADQNVVRQLVAQSLWTQTFVYNGSPTVDLKLHLRIPALQVELWGIPPNRDNPSSTETAQAVAKVDTVITHPDGTFSKGGSFEYGLREFETQLPNQGGGFGFLNFADVDFLGAGGSLLPLLQEDSDFPQSRVRFRFDTTFVTDVDLGLLNTGDTLAYVYTLTAEGTTHGFERGYDAFIGDPFGLNVVTDNLSVTVALAGAPGASVPEPSTWVLLIAGFGSIVGLAYRRAIRQPVLSAQL